MTRTDPWSDLNRSPVYIVDDDKDVRSSLALVLKAAGTTSIAFASGADFLEHLGVLKPGCILLDLRMPHMDGFDVLAELSKRGVRWPAIIVTGHGDVTSAVRAMKLGAFNFVEKPFSEARLIQVLAEGDAILHASARTIQKQREAKEKVESLTSRELEIVRGLLAGLSTKGIAHRLGTSHRTVEVQRASMMAKLRARGVAEAVRVAILGGVEPLP